MSMSAVLWTANYVTHAALQSARTIYVCTILQNLSEFAGFQRM